MTVLKMTPKRRAWSLIFSGHVPVVLNGWSLTKVAAYERRYAFDGKVLARMKSRDHDVRVYPELRPKHTCWVMSVPIGGES